jgi:hypothetical protein
MESKMRGLSLFVCAVVSAAVLCHVPVALAKEKGDQARGDKAATSGHTAEEVTLTPEQIAEFKTDPVAFLLKNNPAGGAKLAALIKALAVAAAKDPTIMAAIAQVAQSANATQAFAIGAGLGQAATALQSTGNKDAANAVQTLVASANNNAMFSGYSAGAASPATLAVPSTDGAGAGGGKSGGGGGGGGIPIAPASFQTSGGGTVSPTRVAAVSSISTASVVTGASNTGTTATGGVSSACRTSVSPVTLCP